MDKSGKWTLSPAFDMTYAYDPSGKQTRVHQIKLQNKQDDFTKEDIVTFGKYCNLSKKQSVEILDMTMKEFSGFEAYANEFKVDVRLKNTVLSSIRKLQYKTFTCKDIFIIHWIGIRYPVTGIYCHRNL